MTRTLISETISKVGETVLIQGTVSTVRNHGKIAFLDISDRTGTLQVVTAPQDLHPQDIVYVTGKVAARPEKLINPKLATGTVELQAEKVELVVKSAELPFDMGTETLDLQLPTLLDYRSLTLRHPHVKDIFKIQAAIFESFRSAAKELNCTEVFVPTISASSTEGGSEVFKVKYYDYETFLIQSPQLYKQMMVPVFERVFLSSHVYRAEPSITTRHLSEVIQMDCELGFTDFPQLLDAFEFVGRTIFTKVASEHPDILEKFGVATPLIPTQIPRLKMREAQQIIKDRTGVDHTNEPDLEPEDEREICRWAKETHNSDLVTVTHYPTKKRAFYTMPDPQDPEFTLSYDLLFRGVEILSGSQRINDHDQLVKVIKSRGMDPENFAMYLMAFKYGMPPEGGFSFGLERLTMLLLGLGNVREASLFPRDMERVDFRLSDQNKVK